MKKVPKIGEILTNSIVGAALLVKIRSTFTKCGEERFVFYLYFLTRPDYCGSPVQVRTYNEIVKYQWKIVE